MVAGMTNKGGCSFGGGGGFIDFLNILGGFPAFAALVVLKQIPVFLLFVFLSVMVGITSQLL